MSTTARDRRVKKEYRFKVARGIPTSLVDAKPYRDHLARIVDLGWTLHSLEHLGPVSHQTYRLLLKGQHSTLERKTAAAVAALPYSLAVPDALPDEAFVPAEGATRRVRALLALGWTRADIQAAVSKRAPDVNVAHVASGAYPRIKARKWRVVAEVYSELHMTVGPSSIGRIRARKAGHLPPLAYDDIDAPGVQTVAWYGSAGTRAERVAEMDEMGFGLAEVCRRLHLSRESFQKWCGNQGMQATYRRLASRDYAFENQYSEAAS